LIWWTRHSRVEREPFQEELNAARKADDARRALAETADSHPAGLFLNHCG